MFKPFRSPILPPIQMSSPPSKKCLMLNHKKKRCSQHTSEVKNAVYIAVKRDGMSLAHIAAVFGIPRGKSAVQNIVINELCDQLVGYQRCRFTSHIMLQLETTVMEQPMLLRRQNSPMSRLVIDISSNSLCILQLHIGIKNHNST